MSNIDAVAPTQSDSSTIHEEDPHDQENAREAYLRQQLAPHANPLTASEMRGVHQELLELKQRRDARAYEAQKKPPALAENIPTYSPPGVDLATQLLIRSGGIARGPSFRHEPAGAPTTTFTSFTSVAGLPTLVALQRLALPHHDASQPPPRVMSESQIREEIDRSKATLLAVKGFAPAETRARIESLETELARRAAPPLVPVNTLSDTKAVAQALAREHSYLTSVEGHFAPPAVRAEHERYEQELVGEIQHHAAEYQAKVQMQRLYAELHAMGDAAGCRPGDTLESLEARRAQLSVLKQERWDAEQQAAESMGLDGKRGSASAVANYAFGEGLSAINPGTGTGVLLAANAAMHGANVEEMRAAGQAGNALEDIGGGVGHALNSNRAPRNDQRRRGATTGLGTDARRVRANGYGAIRLPAEVSDWKPPIKPSASLPTGVPHGDDGLPRINGRRPINFERSGVVIMPRNPEVARRYPEGVRVKPNGFPDFTPYAIASVELDGLVGDVYNDFKAANKAAALDRFGAKPPRGFTWHHCEDGRTMQLVPLDIHEATYHTGGEAVLKHLRREQR